MAIFGLILVALYWNLNPGKPSDLRTVIMNIIEYIP